jgi:hypothetical protein
VVNAFYYVTIQLIFASGGPAGSQTFEKFDRQVLKTVPGMQILSACPVFSGF